MFVIFLGTMVGPKDGQDISLEKRKQERTKFKEDFINIIYEAVCRGRGCTVQVCCCHFEVDHLFKTFGRKGIFYAFKMHFIFYI